RGTAGPSQIADAAVLQWGTAWGDSVILTAGGGGQLGFPIDPPPRSGQATPPFWGGGAGIPPCLPPFRGVARHICRPGPCAPSAFRIASPGGEPPAVAGSALGPSYISRGFRRSVTTFHTTLCRSNSMKGRG